MGEITDEDIYVFLNAYSMGKKNRDRKQTAVDTEARSRAGQASAQRLRKANEFECTCGASKGVRGAGRRKHDPLCPRGIALEEMRTNKADVTDERAAAILKAAEERGITVEMARKRSGELLHERFPAPTEGKILPRGEERNNQKTLGRPRVELGDMPCTCGHCPEGGGSLRGSDAKKCKRAQVAYTRHRREKEKAEASVL